VPVRWHRDDREQILVIDPLLAVGAGDTLLLFVHDELSPDDLKTYCYCICDSDDGLQQQVPMPRPIEAPDSGHHPDRPKHKPDAQS